MALDLKNTLADLAVWEKKIFSLQHTLRQSIITRLLCNAEDLMKASQLHDCKTKRNKSAVAPLLEQALYKWICDQNNRGIMLKIENIKMQGENMMVEANKCLQFGQRLTLKFSTGWIRRFKKRYGTRFLRVNGKGCSADKGAIREKMLEIIRLIQTFGERDVLNVDECWLFYKQHPTWSLLSTTVWELKKEKSHLIFLAWCYADGSEKFSLMAIGNSERPRSFKKKYGRDLGYNYHFNKNA